MEKIKVLYLTTSLTAGGAEIMLKRILSNINLERYEISVCSLTPTLDLFNVLKPLTENIFVLNIKKYYHSLIAFIKLRKLLRREKFDIIHCFMPHANIFGRFASLGLNSKVMSSLWVVLREKKYLNFIDRLTQFLVDIYTVNSNTLRDFTIKNGIKKEKIIVVESGLNFENFKACKNPKELKKDLKLPDLPIVTMIAHLRKQKDYPTMLEALNLLKNEIDINFLICGYGSIFEDETRKILSLIKKYNLWNVKLLGFRNDIPDILSLTDIWVSSTLFEGQSNSLLEAMAMKKPIITTNIPENAEVVRNRKEALLVPTKSPRILANSIKELIEDKELAIKLAVNAYKRVHEKYHISQTISKLENLYSELVNS
ncbi:hypothetical protein LCGC14_1066920 [marine sediment metagenome]|uniref:Glycosyl transferase family 1 domain-containing protein n=1 Tax=marine sediment metagenome TaxID=412755 RepID=A0A0F9QQ76_9ZZZZ